MNFKERIAEDHKKLCDVLKVPHSWVKIKINDWTKVRYVEWLDSIPTDKCKFLQVEFDHQRQAVKYAEYLVDPQYAGVA